MSLTSMQDIDIVVHNPYSDAERIKETIANADRPYFLKLSKRRKETYKILMCRLPGWHAYHSYVKVDIFTSGTINLPTIFASDTPRINNIPVMPLFDLLVMKRWGWWHHRILLREDFLTKVKTDVFNVDALLDRAEEEGVEYDDERAACRHTCEFMEWALVLARRFVRRYRRRGKWKAIGFPLRETRSQFTVRSRLAVTCTILIVFVTTCRSEPDA